MKQKIIFSSVFILAGVIAVFGIANAQTTIDDDTTKTRAEIQTDRKADIKEAKEDRKEIREERKEQICKNTEARIRTRISRYENNQRANRNVFSNMLTRLDKVVERFQALELDTDELEADIKTLEQKINELYEVHDTFISELEETQDYACGKSDGEFKSKLGESRKVSQEVREDIIEIREFYQTTVRPEILDLRDQIEDDDDDEDESEDEEEGQESEGSDE